jgi:hypothetical protein
MKIRIEKIEIDVDEKFVDEVSQAVMQLEAIRAQSDAARAHESRLGRESEKSLQLQLAAMLIPILQDLFTPRAPEDELPKEESEGAVPSDAVNGEPA